MRKHLKMIMHTERVIPSERYLIDWITAMRKSTTIPESVISDIVKNGKGTWKSNDNGENVETTYEIREFTEEGRIIERKKCKDNRD